jgi:hypothetical protein
MSAGKNGVVIGVIVALVVMVYFDGNAIAFFETGENTKGILYIALNILSIPLGILGSRIANRIGFLRIFLQIVFSMLLVVALNFFLDKILAPPDFDDVMESNISEQYIPENLSN